MARIAAEAKTLATEPRPRTRHEVLFGDSRDLSAIPDCSIDLVVTSPPYPMIEMWDETFAALNPAVSPALASGDGPRAFELMHGELDKVWRECLRVLRPGAIACVNIGDAVRTIGGDFRIYSNHARVLSAMSGLGFHALPDILWRKQTNAPNKFMGSGMLPAGAYVTYEHEYVLIFRKGGKREFDTEESKGRRRASAYFWEERNVWFSDVWTDLKGTSQQLCDKSARERSAAYPFELAFRLVSMYSIYGDVVLDPFLGTGTTSAAAVAACRNSVGVERQRELLPAISESVSNAARDGAARLRARVAAHRAFVAERLASGFRFKHTNVPHRFPVMTSQETDLTLYLPDRVERGSETQFEIVYRGLGASDAPESEQLQLFCAPPAGKDAVCAGIADSRRRLAKR